MPDVPSGKGVLRVSAKAAFNCLNVCMTFREDFFGLISFGNVKQTMRNASFEGVLRNKQ